MFTLINGCELQNKGGPDKVPRSSLLEPGVGKTQSQSFTSSIPGWRSTDQDRRELIFIPRVWRVYIRSLGTEEGGFSSDMEVKVETRGPLEGNLGLLRGRSQHSLKAPSAEAKPGS